jgi:carboxyl-terminal processing protease
MKLHIRPYLKALILIFNIIGFTANTQAQTSPMPDSAKNFLDTVINIIHRESLNSDSVNWDNLKNEVYHRAENAKTIKDLFPAIRYIFDQLHDNHGAIVYKGIHYGATHKPVPQIDKELMLKVKAVGYPKLKVRVLNNNYGYVLVPALEASSTDDYNKYAQQIKDSICSIYSKKIKGWIIDLRLNPGGNMWPMLGGIGVIIGDGKVGSFVNKKGEILQAWSVKNGDAYFDTARLTTTISKCNIGHKIKIAVLIGPLTQSSGEAIAIALEGRPNTMFFGENTGGFTTANMPNQLNYNITLLVASSIEADRNKKPYPKLVTPDVFIAGGDDFIDLDKDAKIIAALKWLKH